MEPSEIRPGIRRLFHLDTDRPDRVQADADAEIRLHLALRTEQLVRAGFTPDVARDEAIRRFGAIEESRQLLHQSSAKREQKRRIRERVDGIARDLRVALRALRRSPGFVLTAVSCIALGVGSNAAAFSVFEELLLRPLPVHRPGELVNLSAPGPRIGSDQCNMSGPCDEVFSYAMFRDLQQRPTGLAGIAAHRTFFASIGTPSGTRHAAEAEGLFVSGSYFPVLGVRPALGRLFAAADDETLGGHPVAVLSHSWWTTHLGADSTIVGRQLRVNGRLLTVLGVVPAGFEGTTLGRRPAIYVPLAMEAAVDPNFGPASEMLNRRRYWLYLFGRLAPGVTLARAQAELTAAYQPILAERDAPLQVGMSAATMKRFLAREVGVTDGRHGQSVLRDTTRDPLVLLFATTGLVVLIACANIANLLLVRGAGRGTEIAVRLSLGASRRHLVAQLLTESCVLAILGGLASLVVAWATLRLIGSFIPPASLGFGAALSLAIRPTVALFAGAVALGTGLLFGLFPALHATRPDLIARLRSGAGHITGGHRAAARFRSSLVTAQFALSMALLASAGLFIRSLQMVGDVDLGMQTEHVLTFTLLPELSGYDPGRSRALFARVEEEVRSVPGVASVSGSALPLLTGSSWGGNVSVEGFERGPDTDVNTRLNKVSPGFFHTLGIALREGREFSASDRADAPRVAIVSEAFARKFNLGPTPVGKRMSIDGYSPKGTLDIEIVGVARDASYSDVKSVVPPLVYTPWRQDTTVTTMAYYVRTTAAPEAVLSAIPAAVARLDRSLSVSMLKTFPQQIRESVYLDRMVGVLSAVFAALATLLAAVSLYGVLSYTVALRTREIGVRMALGADGRRVRGIVLTQVARMVGVGALIGLVAALLLGRAAQSLLFGVQGNDPIVIGLTVALLAVVAMGAGYLPAWRASRLEPIQALRRD